MVQNSIFGLLTTGASLYKCSESLACPVLQKRQSREQQQQQRSEAPPARKREKKGAGIPEASRTPESIRKQHSISVSGLTDIPPPFRSFADELPHHDPDAVDEECNAAHGRGDSPAPPRKLPAWLVSRLEALGYKEPTPIQMQALPLLLKGYHILASSPTGSGKTLAFLLPLIACLKAPRAEFSRLVVLSPTRELARQSLRTFEKLTEGSGFKAAFPQTHSGGRYGTADAIFATPLSLLTLLQKKRLSLSDCQHLVLDEADRLLDSGFSPQVDTILSELKGAARANKRLHICLFSATLPPSVVLLAESIAYGAVHVAVGRASAAAPQIEQELVFCSTEAGKLWALKNLRIEMRLIPPCLIFVETQERASELLREMISEGMAVDLLHAAKSKQQRDATVDAFRTGKIWFLICTDLVARGVDFKGVALVINFDLPLSTSVYIHRIGRTGRAGKQGKAITFFTLDDVPKLRPIVQIMRKSPNSKIPDFLNSKLTRNLRVKGQKKYRGAYKPHGKGAFRRIRKPIRPITQAAHLKARRRAWAVAASRAKKKRMEDSNSERVKRPDPEDVKSPSMATTRVDAAEEASGGGSHAEEGKGQRRTKHTGERKVRSSTSRKRPHTQAGGAVPLKRIAKQS
ncbi:DEAD-box ATP-dependent RNA helicase 57 [Cyclospora cayetanensis]|uniref:RNA helicase n=2 Tax=Cyclospora cayetanensis TaxID=88456 RepID=A0A1D3CVQ8_9EIME|nr:DEAD-box ATP-dependent RNA helicase 57 [Cyclospora cayetanensis]OEH75287.1 ATP-dependent rna [Cyclospora cayetanensis]